MWIGLNPSTANEHKLDPTLKRIAAFSKREGYDGFIMTNLFAWRSTQPAKMMAAVDPVGRQNNRWIAKMAKRCDTVIAAWGTSGSHRARDVEVRKLLSTHRVTCLGVTKQGHPRHPLYVKGTQRFVAFERP